MLVTQGEESVNVADFVIIQGLQLDGSGFSQCLKVKRRTTGTLYAMYILNKSAIKEKERYP